MKSKLLFVLSVLSCVTMARAVVVSEATFCRVQVNSGTRATLLSLPVTEVGVAGDQVSLDKVVLTDNLVDGTRLFSKCNGVTYAWELVGGKWQPVLTVSGSTVADSSGVDSLARGVAFWVERAGTAADFAKPFYIYGLLGQSLAGEQAITPGTEEVPAYTRVGNPNPEDRLLNDLIWSGCATGDLIAMGSNDDKLQYVEYRWDAAKNQWGREETQTVIMANGKKRAKFVWNPTVVVPAGQAFWYIRKTNAPASVRFK